MRRAEKVYIHMFRQCPKSAAGTLSFQQTESFGLIDLQEETSDESSSQCQMYV